VEAPIRWEGQQFIIYLYWSAPKAGNAGGI